ncbi:MAG: ABC transporter permease, partial [Clostridium perfringens]|nr:ABC transporter permease [Clostridium perfringens]
MNSVKMAYRLLKNNFKIYGLYLTVLIVSVATYYNFVAIQYNDKFQELAERLQSATLVSGLCGFVLIITVIFFMWHANGFFLKQREKETGLYMLMGISASKIGEIFAIESIFLGTLAFVIGLPIGILFSKLFFMLLSKSITLDTQLPFQVSPKSIIQVIIVFVLIFIFLGLRNYNVVKKSQLINMINATKRKSTVPKLNYGKGILGVVLIVIGYIIGLHVKKWEIDLMVATMSTLILVCMGTYMLFGSFLSIVFSKLIKCKNIIYKNVRLVAISNIFFRLKANYRSLAMTTILAASTVTALGVSLSFKQYANDEVIMEAPYSISYKTESQKVDDDVDNVIKESGNELAGSNYLNFFVGKIEHTKKNKSNPETTEVIVTSYSQVKKNLEFLNFR